VITNLPEPFGGIQDFLDARQSLQTVREDGTIEMSYDQLAAKDAIIGLYPTVTTGTKRRSRRWAVRRLRMSLLTSISKCKSLGG
jgi:hypothetical protein